MQQNKKKTLARILSMAFVVSILANVCVMPTYAQEPQNHQMVPNTAVSQAAGAETPEAIPTEQPQISTMPEQSAEATASAVPQATATPVTSATPSASPEPSIAPVLPDATAVPSQEPETSGQETPVSDLENQKSRIQELLSKGTSLTEMSEEELNATLEEIQELATMPAAQADGASDTELQTLMQQLTNMQAAMEDMRMARQAQREGWLDQLPQTGKENSWRYQNGERLVDNGAENDQDVPDGVSLFSANGYWGIDVSHHQGVINWDAVKAAGIDFAVIRCGYGADQTDQDDKQWARNVSECERLGIPYGVYFYSYAVTADMAVSEAAHAVRLLQGHHPDLPVFYDMEENRQLVVGNSGLAEMARIFNDIVSSAGYEVGVYSSLNWWNQYLTDPVFENWYRWVAQWGSACTYGGRYEMWQYTSGGTVNGISGNVDMNHWYGEIGPTAKPVDVEAGTYVIHSALNYQAVLDIDGASMKDGGNVQIYAANQSAAQQFTLVSAGNHSYTIQNVNSQKVLDIDGGRMVPGTNVQQWNANGSDAQKWYLEDAGDGFYYIRSVGGNLYLDVANGSSSNGTNVRVYTGNQSTAQKFRLEKVEAKSQIVQGIYTIQASVGNNKVLDIAGGSTANGANVQLYSGNGTDAQQFAIYAAGTGSYSIRNVASGKVLDVKDGSTAQRANVQQWESNGTKAQQWNFIAAGDGSYFIQSCASGLYLDIDNGSAANGANIQMYTLNRSNAQKFRLIPVTGQAAVQEGSYVLHSGQQYQKVLDIANGSKANGANVQLYQANDTSAQTFRIYAAGDGYYVIQNEASGKVLDVSGAGTAPQTNVQQWAQNGSAAQQWRFVDAGSGYYYIQSRCNGLYLDVSGGSTANGANIQVYTGNRSAAQKFYLEYKAASMTIQPGTYTIQTALTANKVLDVSAASKASGANVQIYGANGTTAQRFQIVSAGNGYYTIQNVNSGKVLDVADAGQKAGANVQQWTSNGTAAQKWRFVDAGDGYYYIQSKCNGLYLDVASGSTADGANVQVYTGNQSRAQKFKLIQA